MKRAIPKPEPKPNTEDTTSPISTLDHSFMLTADKPPRAMAAPVMPAISAWLSLVGMPKYHAATAQTTMANMAAVNATSDCWLPEGPNPPCC